jgi:hypothetical protein
VHASRPGRIYMYIYYKAGGFNKPQQRPVNNARTGGPSHPSRQLHRHRNGRQHKTRAIRNIERGRPLQWCTTWQGHACCHGLGHSLVGSTPFPAASVPGRPVPAPGGPDRYPPPYPTCPPSAGILSHRPSIHVQYILPPRPVILSTYVSPRVRAPAGRAYVGTPASVEGEQTHSTYSMSCRRVKTRP